MKLTGLLVLTCLAVAACGGSAATTTQLAATSTTAQAAATTTTIAPVAPTTTVGDTTTTAVPATTTTVVLGPDATIDIVNFSFSPKNVTVAVGTKITWTDRDTANHTTTADGGLWDSKTLFEGAQFTFQFDQPGVYPFHCKIHPSMKGTVTVVG